MSSTNFINNIIYLLNKNKNLNLHLHNKESIECLPKVEACYSDTSLTASTSRKIGNTQLVQDPNLSRLPHDFWRSYEHDIHYQSENSHAH